MHALREVRSRDLLDGMKAAAGGSPAAAGIAAIQPITEFLMAVDCDFFPGETVGPRLEALPTAALDQEGVRLPGTRRLQARRRAALHGPRIPATLYQKLKLLAQTPLSWWISKQRSPSRTPSLFPSVFTVSHFAHSNG